MRHGSDQGAMGVAGPVPSLEGGAANPARDFGESQALITDLLRQWTDGDPNALGQVVGHVYSQLRQVAAYAVINERSCNSLQATALINETYLRLCGNENLRFTSRLQFYSFAGETMRRILVEHARARNRFKRGGAFQRVPIDGQLAIPIRSGWDPLMMLALDKALERVKAIDVRRYKIAVWWFFGGLSAEEIGTLLDASASTIRRELRAVRCWLAFELRKK